MTKEEFIQQMADIYNCEPDHPWEKYPANMVFRHTISKKWFALLMPVAADKLGKAENRLLDVVNLKADKYLIPDLRREKGIYPAYHMNKGYWISVVLEEVTPAMTAKLVEQSFQLTRESPLKKCRFHHKDV